MLVSIAVVGIAARLGLWWNSTGTRDVDRWMLFGRHIHEHGLAATYESLDKFNHPPLMGLYAAAVWDVTLQRSVELRPSVQASRAARRGTVLVVVARLSGSPRLLLMLIAPAAVLVSSYHGNTDSLYVAFLLPAVLAFDRDRFLWSASCSARPSTSSCIAAIVALALASRFRLRLPMIAQLAFGGALFLLLTPGFGLQYVVLIAPLLIFVSLRYAIAWYWLAGAFIGVRYSISLITDKSSWSEGNENFREFASALGVLAWALLALFLWQAFTARTPADGSDTGGEELESA